MIIQRRLISNLRRWCPEYGASFFPVKFKRAKDISNPDIPFVFGIFAINYNGVFMSEFGLDDFSRKEVISISFEDVSKWESHKLSGKDDAAGTEILR